MAERDNVKAGIFVLLGLILALAVVYLLADTGRYFQNRQSVRVYFDLAQGLQGLKEGAQVTLGDQPVGEVTRIEDHRAESRGDGKHGAARGPVVVGKVVTCSIPAEYAIHWNAEIELMPPLLSSGTKLNIRSVGDGERYDPAGSIPEGIARGARDDESLFELLAGEATTEPATRPHAHRYRGPKDAIPGAAGGSTLTRSLGIDDAQRAQIKMIIRNVAKLSRDVGEDVPALLAKLKALTDEAGPVVKNANTASEDLKAALADARKTAAYAEEVTGKVRERSGPWLDRIDATTTSVKNATGTAEAIIKDKDPAIRNTIDNVEAITKTAREKTLAQVTEALDKANTAMADLSASSKEIRGLVAGQRPVIERALANAQLTTDQLKLAAIEVRRSPWRLLYTPGDKELETDNLYDASRSFAQAASALDSAVQSLRAIANQPTAGSTAPGIPPEDAKKMLDRLEKLFVKFHEAEDGFWKALKSQTPAEK